MKDKMIKAFQKANGGLFDRVEKADVGNAYQEMAKAGVLLMGWADPFMPDYVMPKHIEQALITAIKDPSAAHYTAPIGNQLLKEKLAVKLQSFNRLTVDPNRNILITPGSDSGLYFAMLPFINPGDEVIVFAPSYPNNFLNIQIMQGTVVPVLLSESEHYQINEENLRAAITERTKLIVMTHPNNPTTTVFNRTSLEILRSVLIEHDLILVCDQAFEDFCYEGEFITPQALPGLFERTVSVFSFSKGMGLSGLRVGYIVCSDQIMDSMYANAVTVLGATNTASQQAIIAALDDQTFMQEFREAYDFRRKAATAIINSIPQVHMDLPESGFLGWINVSALGSSTEIAKFLTDDAQVALNDGINYGPGGEGHLRIVLGVYRDNDKIIEALNRIRKSLLKWQEINKPAY